MSQQDISELVSAARRGQPARARVVARLFGLSLENLQRLTRQGNFPGGAALTSRRAEYDARTIAHRLGIDINRVSGEHI